MCTHADVCADADWQRNWVQTLSPYGKEDHPLWHGCRPHLQVRCCRLPGPLRQVSVFPLLKKMFQLRFLLFVSFVRSTFFSALRVFNINSGKQKKLYKGSLSEDGSLIRVTFLATVRSPSLYLHGVDSFLTLFVLTGPAWSIRSIRGHQLLQQKHQHLWIQHRGMCGHDVWTLW